MKLSTILENITKREFFDFYALLDAYQDRQNLNHDEIANHLQFVANNILTDHLNQLGSILVDRLLDPEHAPTREILDKYGIEVDEDFIYHGVENLTLKQKAEIIAAVLPFNHSHGFTGETWHGLGKGFLKLLNTPHHLDSKIRAIDKVYNLTHHNGQITDYMDERNWLEDALNMRDNANPAQIFAQASPNVRALIGRSAHARQNQLPVSEIAKLYTALRRATGDKSIEIDTSPSKTPNRIDVTANFNEIIESGKPMPMVAWNGEIPDRFKNILKLGKSLTGKVAVIDKGDRLIVTDGKTQIPVIKPINRQFNLANDIIYAAVDVGQTGKIWEHRIKKSYHFIDGKKAKP